MNKSRLNINNYNKKLKIINKLINFNNHEMKINFMLIQYSIVIMIYNYHKIIKFKVFINKIINKLSNIFKIN